MPRAYPSTHFSLVTRWLTNLPTNSHDPCYGSLVELIDKRQKAKLLPTNNINSDWLILRVQQSDQLIKFDQFNLKKYRVDY